MAYFQLPADGVGKKLDASTYTTADGTVYAQKLVICDASGNIVGVTANRLQVDGSGVTQPVSGSVSVSNLPATQPVSLATAPTTPVTGSFWQATQPVSLATNAPDVTDRSARLLGHVTVDSAPTTSVTAASLPLPTGAATETTLGTVAKDATLTGGTQKAIARTAAKGTTAAADLTSAAVDANTQALHTNVTNFPASQAVTGTFFQATQPVSLATAPTTPVTGTFFQATQPVSLASSPTTPVTGTFWQATQPVSLATNTPDVTDRSARLLGHVTVDSAPTTAVTAAALPLPAGASTETTLAAVNTKLGGTLVVDTELPAAAALADGATNPTTPLSGSPALIFNGTTWDRERGNWDTTTGDAGTKTATFAGATQTNYNARGAFILVKLGTVSGTTPTLSCQLQWSYDGGTSWLNVGTALANLTATNNTGAILVYPANLTVAGATPATLTTGATATTYLNMSLPRLWRVNYTIGGSTPSFALTATYVNYSL